MRLGLKIVAVGDICPGDKAIMGLGVMSKSKKVGGDFYFDKVRHLLHDADFAIGNLEGLLTEAVYGPRLAELTFSGIPKFAEALSSSGFHVLNVANNHTLEHGSTIFQETVDLLRKAGIAVCGLRSRSPEYWSDPVVLRKKGMTVGIIGYNWVGVDKFANADDWIAQSRDSLVNYTWERNCGAGSRHRNNPAAQNHKVIGDIRRLRRDVDFLILCAHWGFEFVHIPPYGITLEAQSFIDAGADLILGHHPHVIQGMERYQERDIYYSLGNFIFDMRSAMSRRSVILEYTWSPASGGSHRFLPVVIDKTFRPVAADGTAAARVQRIIAESSARIHAAGKGHRLLDDDAVYREYERQYRIGKLRQAVDHFTAIPEDPRMLLLIAAKARGALDLVANRLRGKKVRW